MNSTQKSKNRSSILLVEDDAVAAEIIGQIIFCKYPDVVITIANNGVQGLELFKEYLPELVITDINMHEMDGIELARAIKSIREETKFIVFSGSSDQKNVEIFNEIGVVEYIVKPVDLEKLLAAIEQCKN
jgi:YesN/AraC family two-component response regulator